MRHPLLISLGGLVSLMGLFSCASAPAPIDSGDTGRVLAALAPENPEAAPSLVSEEGIDADTEREAETDTNEDAAPTLLAESGLLAEERAETPMAEGDLPVIEETFPAFVRPENIPFDRPTTASLSKGIETLAYLEELSARPEFPPVPPVPEQIMGTGRIDSDSLSAFLLETNPWADPFFVEPLILIYIEEAAIEGINHDIAFAQMCLETGFLQYGGLVTPDMNNFCGLGAIGSDQAGEYFESPRIGVRAHIQHLKAYATEEPLRQDLVDPRFHWVRYGSSPLIYGLAGTWAADRQYASKIQRILNRLYTFSYGSD